MTCRGLTAAVAATCMLAGLAQAQKPPDEKLGQLEKVMVTGSRLSRPDLETPSPVQIVTREEIDRSGAVSLAEVMQRLPASNSGTFSENSIAGNGAGGVSLHGLGANSTLVLINGRRVSSFGFADPFGFGQGTFVDLNQIPVSVIERVEILLDGASALYGSDAVAGVVNVILRRDYRGAEASASFGRSTHGDSTQRQASVTFGFGDRRDDGYNLFASFARIDQDPVKASARWHSRTGDYRGFGLDDYRTSNAYPGNLYTADNRTFLQPLAGCALIGEATSANPGRCLLDESASQDIVAGSHRDALFMAGTAALRRGFELFGDATFSRTVSRISQWGVPVTSYFNLGVLPHPFILLPAGDPQNPYPTEVALRTRFNDVPEATTPTSDTQRVVIGVRHGNLAGWDVESGLLWSHSLTRVATTGLVDEKVLVREVVDADGRAVPSFRFGDPGANDPSLMARLYPRLEAVGETSLVSIDVRGRRDLIELPGGTMQIALGAEARRERFSTAPDPLTESGDVSLLSGWKATGSRNVGSAYAELALPLLRTFEASLAARYDHYDDFGGTFNSKAGVKWKLASGVAVRATYSTAFRAPSAIETRQAPIRVFVEVRDPRTCAVADASNPNCDVVVDSVYSGNPGLRPERARSTTAGIVVEPWRNAAFTVDVFRIHRHDQASAIDPNYLLANESLYSGVVRNADGTLREIDLKPSNLASVRVSGLDATAKARTTVEGIGRLGVDGSYEWLPHYRIRPTPDAQDADYAGTYAQPKSRARLSFSVDRGPWQSSLSVNYTGRYLRSFSALDLSCPYDAPGSIHPELCNIRSWRTTDLFIGYTGIANLELGLLIRNLDNVQAPFDSNNVPGVFTAYDPSYHSAVGRFFQLTGKYTFR